MSILGGHRHRNAYIVIYDRAAAAGATAVEDHGTRLTMSDPVTAVVPPTPGVPDEWVWEGTGVVLSGANAAWNTAVANAPWRVVKVGPIPITEERPGISGTTYSEVEKMHMEIVDDSGSGVLSFPQLEVAALKRFISIIPISASTLHCCQT